MVTVFHADDAQPTNKDSRRQPACLGSALQNKESLSSCQQACFIDSHPRHTIDTNSNDGEDNKSSGEPITSNDSLLAARDLCDTAHTTHTRRNYRVNKWYPAPPPPKQNRGHSFAILGKVPSLQILWSMPSIANLGVPALLTVQLLLKHGGMPSQTTPLLQNVK